MMRFIDVVNKQKLLIVYIILHKLDKNVYYIYLYPIYTLIIYYDVTLLFHKNVSITSAIVGSSEMNIGDVVHQLVHLYVLFSQ